LKYGRKSHLSSFLSLIILQSVSVFSLILHLSKALVTAFAISVWRYSCESLLIPFPSSRGEKKAKLPALIGVLPSLSRREGYFTRTVAKPMPPGLAETVQLLAYSLY